MQPKQLWDTVHGIIREILTNSVTPWSRVLEKITVTQLLKKFPAFMEPKALQCSQAHY